VSADAGMRGGKAVPYKHLLDEAIRLREPMVQFLRQEMHASEGYDACRLHLQHIVS